VEVQGLAEILMPPDNVSESDELVGLQVLFVYRIRTCSLVFLKVREACG